MILPTSKQPIPPGALRSTRGRGRPYPAGTIAMVRKLVETTALRFDEIAVREGVHEATVGRWARRFGWRRPEDDRNSRSRHAEERTKSASRSTQNGGACFETPAAQAPQHDAVGRAQTGESIRRVPYGSADHEAARVLIEGSRLGLEAIGNRLGIGTATLFRWQRRFGWQRPSGPDRPGPMHYRYRTRHGRPYAADAVGIAQRLATQTLMSQKRIAVQAGVSQATVSNWIRDRGWARPEPKRGSHRFAATRRTAPVVTSGDRRGRSYTEDTVAEVRRLYQQTELPTANIGARLGVSQVTVARWAKTKGWTRPRDLPDTYGRPRRRRRRRW